MGLAFGRRSDRSNLTQHSPTTFNHVISESQQSALWQ
jgi:hypothetical protein